VRFSESHDIPRPEITYRECRVPVGAVREPPLQGGCRFGSRAGSFSENGSPAREARDLRSFRNRGASAPRERAILTPYRDGDEARWPIRRPGISSAALKGCATRKKVVRSILGRLLELVRERQICAVQRPSVIPAKLVPGLNGERGSRTSGNLWTPACAGVTVCGVLGEVPSPFGRTRPAGGFPAAGSEAPFRRLPGCERRAPRSPPRSGPRAGPP